MKNNYNKMTTMPLVKRMLFAATAMLSANAFAAPFNPNPFKVSNQGDTITIQRIGDEHYNFTQTTDGHLIEKDTTGVYRYIGEDGSLSDIKVKSKLSLADSLYLDEIDKQKVRDAHRDKHPMRHMRPEGEKSEKKANWVPSGQNTDGVHPLMRMPSGEAHGKGTNRFPVILVAGSGKTNADSTAYSNRLNQEGYNLDNHTGSVRDYFKDQSNGQFVPTYDVYLVTVSGTQSNYINNEGQLIADAISSLLSKYPNFDATKYDSDGDGEVDAVGVLYAGTENESNNLGGFQYELQWNSQGRQNAGNGKKFNNYLLISQLESEGVLLPIATFVHEFSHTMGLRDHYSVMNYPETVTTQFPGAHAWDVMATGMYNNGGATPAGYSAFEKEFMGWITTKTLSTNDTTTVITPLNTTNLAYKVAVDSDEFYLLENRQQTKWDAHLPYHGMLIWHIDYDQEAWDGDVMNDVEDHQRVDVVEAGNIAVTKYGEGFDASYLKDDPFPGTQNVTSFDGFNSWAGASLGVSLYNITEKDNNIYFTTKSDVAVDTNTKADTTGTTNGNTDTKTESQTYEFSFNISLQISSNYAYEKVDLSALFDSLSASNPSSLYTAGSMTYNAINPDGTTDSKSTANAPGHWFDADGNTSSYANGYIYSEMDLSNKVAKVGHYPDKVKKGETYTTKQSFTYNGNVAIFTITTTIIDTTSTKVSEAKTDAIAIYISGNTLTIDGMGEEEKMLSIYNASGAMIYNATISCSSKTINIDGTGVYIVKLSNASGNITAKKIVAE